MKLLDKEQVEKINRIIVIGEFGSSGAALNRVNLEIDGLNKHGLSCLKFNLTSTYKYIFIFPLLMRFFKSFCLFFQIKSTDRIIVYGFTLFTPLDILFLRLRGCNIFFERNEYPFTLIADSIKISKLKYRLEKLQDISCLKQLKYARGFITCSQSLENFYKKYTSSTTKFIRIPLLVDNDKFSVPGKKKDNKYIAYCGYMGNNKDGVSILIDAFKIIAPLYTINLMLIGSAEQYVMDKLREQARGLEDRILFTGLVDHKEMPGLLASAAMLVLASPNNKQAEGGFPSKLGEYLATGIPVVVTKVGEISDYIHDGINDFVAEPDDVDSFAGKMKFVLDNYDNALSIGKKGQELVKQFDYKQQGILLKDFLLSIT
jgi:glycosyltransferase involved in cell wall biosynthesis